MRTVLPFAPFRKYVHVCLLLLVIYFCFPRFSVGAEAGFPQLQWLHSSADRLQHLSFSPVECLGQPANAEQLFLIEVGRQAFRSPALLGGQAARAGLSCQGCHINGHGHSTFYIEGLSGDMGTVDVTTAVFSEIRGDGVHNPVTIPSLVDIFQKASFGTVAPNASLSDFVEALIVEEFAGEAPSAIQLKALVAYLQALRSSCSTTAAGLNNLDQQLLNISRSVNVLEQAYENGEPSLANFLLLTTQHELSTLYQRFTLEETAEAGQNIINMSRRLGELKDNSEGSVFLDTLASWAADWQAFTLELRAQESKSLYQPEVLVDWLFLNFPP